jgi:hypothetical protein
MTNATKDRGKEFIFMVRRVGSSFSATRLANSGHSCRVCSYTLDHLTEPPESARYFPLDLMSSALERQIKPIYGELLAYAGELSRALTIPDLTACFFPLHTDALDSGSNKSALVAANKFLKKTPKNALVQVGGIYLLGILAGR